MSHEQNLASMRRFGEEVGRVRDSLAAWQLRVPQLRTTWDALGHSFGQSVNDLASLRMQSDGGGIGKLPGAGVPWFMTVFGRDTLITSLQTLLLGALGYGLGWVVVERNGTALLRSGVGRG